MANKTDLTTESSNRQRQLQVATGCDVCAISASRGEGLEALKQLMNSMAEGLDKQHEASVLVTSLRHYDALRNARHALDQAQLLIDNSSGTELVAFELRSSLEYIGEITGKVVNDDILTIIFERFCIGK